jgi:peptide/nickel transport system substrate-binding protein
MNGKTYTLLAAAIAIAVMAVYGVNVVRASSTPTVTIIEAIPGTVIVSPGVPIWNPYAPGNLIGTAGTYMPLALYNPTSIS